MKEEQDLSNDSELEVEDVEISSYGNLMESRMSILDDLLMEKLEKAFNQATSMVLVHDIAKIASEYDAIDLAYAIPRLPATARHVVYDNLPDLHAKVIFMINTDSVTRAAVFRAIDDREIKRIIDNMPLDEAVWLLDDLSDRRLKRVLELLDPKKVYRIRELMRHDRNSAARLMTNEFFVFNMNVTIGEVTKSIRDNPGIDLTRRIFVTSTVGQLIGYVPARNIIVNPQHLPLRQVMRPVLHKVEPDTCRDEVVDLVERYKISALPVVNESGVMLGVITYEVVVEAMEDIGDETIATIAGTKEAYSENEPIFRRVFSRAPWLVVTFASGLVTATALSNFAGRAWFIGVVPFFVPLINGMSGNVGLQCSTLLVRAMGTGELSTGIKHRAMLKELLIGLNIGTGFGLMTWLVVFLLNAVGIYALGEPLTIGATLGAGVFSACLTATSLGVFFPFFFARMGIDPAVASGPLVTAFNDLCSTLIFLLIAFLVYSFVG